MTISLALLLIYPAFSNAHTSLISSNPADKSTVKSMPAEITLTFNEDLMVLGGKQVSKFSLHDKSHHELRLGKFEVSGGTIKASVKEKSEALGKYKIYYRVISADGHPVSGVLTFFNQTSSPTNEIDVQFSFNWDSIKHWVNHHKWHILETLFALGLIIAWAIYRRRNRE